MSPQDVQKFTTRVNSTHLHLLQLPTSLWISTTSAPSRTWAPIKPISASEDPAWRASCGMSD